MYTLKNKVPSSVPKKSAAPTHVLKKSIPEKRQAITSQEKTKQKATATVSFNNKKKKVLLSWQSIQFESVPKSSTWYVVVFVVLVTLVAVGLFTDNFPLAILAILIGLILYLFEKKESQYFRFGVTSEGVLAQDSLYKFSSLKDFWIFYEPNGRKILSLKSKKSLIPYIQIPLGDTDPNTLRDILKDFLPEKEHEEALVDSLEQLI